MYGNEAIFKTNIIRLNFVIVVFSYYTSLSH